MADEPIHETGAVTVGHPDPERSREDILDLRRFRVVETSPASAISTATVFEFKETEGIVEGRYSGGQIVSGVLTGRRSGDHVAFAYTQLGRDGALRTGISNMRVESHIERPLRLREEFTWSDGTRGTNVLEAE
jgi:hypothetical protein